MPMTYHFVPIWVGHSVLILAIGLSCLATLPSPDAQAQTPAERTRANWTLAAGDTLYEGTRSFVDRDDDLLWINVVGRNGVNFGLFLREDEPGAYTVNDASFALGRGPRCRLVVSDPPFTINHDPAPPGWLRATFAGVLACPGFIALPISGSFTVPDVEVER